MLDTQFSMSDPIPPERSGQPAGDPQAARRGPVPLSKLAFDKLFALAALVLLAPALAAIGLAVRLGGGGPVVFAHERIGHNGRIFRCLKFRTMRPDSQKDLDDVLRVDPIAREEWTEQRKLERDPRVDRMGYLLRVTSLDELPQFWNVLKGDMSIVGPRPITQAEVEKYGDLITDYTSVRPGLTGIWQVSGRSDTSYERRVALDVSYVRNWSLWQDLRITLKTVSVLVAGRGAY